MFALVFLILLGCLRSAFLNACKAFNAMCSGPGVLASGPWALLLSKWLRMLEVQNELLSACHCCFNMLEHDQKVRSHVSWVVAVLWRNVFVCWVRPCDHTRYVCGDIIRSKEKILRVVLVPSNVFIVDAHAQGCIHDCNIDYGSIMLGVDVCSCLYVELY